MVTQLVAGGVDWRTVSGRAGHADGHMTLATYAHFQQAQDRGSNTLRAVLQELGWSRTRLVAELRRQAACSGDTLPGTESLIAMVSRWVNNYQQPRDFYRELLRMPRVPLNFGGGPMIVRPLPPPPEPRMTR